jgi:hypothetical protein
VIGCVTGPLGRDHFVVKRKYILPLKTLFSIPKHTKETRYVEVKRKNAILRVLVAGASGLNVWHAKFTKMR